MTETQYFTDTFATLPTLLRRRPGHLDEAWVDGEWRPTKRIIDWMFGHNDFVEQINEAEAIKWQPEAHGR